MRDRDSLILESLYENILLNENKIELSSFENRMLENFSKEIKKYFNSSFVRQHNYIIHLNNEKITKNGSQIDLSDSYKIAKETFFNSAVPKIEIDKGSSTSSTYSSEDERRIKLSIEATFNRVAKEKYWNVVWDARDDKKRIDKEEYDELKNPIELYENDMELNYSYHYLKAIESNGLSNIYDSEGWDDPEYIAENNSDVNVLSIMNNILYPVKGMEKFHDMYENLFKKMIVEENPKHPTYPKVMLFNSELESKIVSNELIKYLGKEEFSLHKQFLNILAHMIVYQFKDDPNLNGDYSPLLYMSAFVF